MGELARELGQPSQHWWMAAHGATLALLEGRLSDAETLIDRARTLGERAQGYDALTYYHLQRFALRREQGRLAEILADLERAAEADPERALLRCALALAYQSLGQAKRAQRLYTDLATNDFAVLAVNNDWLLAAALLAEIAGSMNDPESADALYLRLVPFGGLSVDTYEVSTGAVSRYLGLLAVATGRLEDAAGYFGKALEMNEHIGARPWHARTQDDYAHMLLAREKRGDRELASQLFDQALATYRELGMKSHAAPAETLTSR